MRGGPPGDLYIFLSIKPHEFFQRDGADLFCRVPIAMTTAALGGQIEVPTIDGGRTRVKIPEGTESGKQFRLKAKGMPVLRSKQQGDLYIQVEVETPKNLTAQAARAAEVFRGCLEREHQPGIDRLLRPRQGILRGPIAAPRLSAIYLSDIPHVSLTIPRIIGAYLANRVGAPLARTSTGGVTNAALVLRRQHAGRLATTRSSPRLAQHIADANGIEAVFVDLKDYPMPLYNGDLEAEDGPPREGARVQGAARRVSGRVHRQPRI